MSDKLLKKIVKKNYNNELEEVLAKKNYPLEVKNELLSIFYKIENGYNDYKTVKRETFEKKQYKEKLIYIIDKECDNIEFTKNKKEQKIDRKNKQIICYPIETNILYSLAKIQKGKTVVNYLDKDIDDALTFVLNVGNNINIVEPLRDFNGFSWNVIIQDIEDIKCNLIYQNIIYLLGNIFVDKWVNNYDPLIDYFELFAEKIKENYDEKTKETIITSLVKLAILIKIQYNEEYKCEIQKKFEKTEDVYYELENLTMFISKNTNYKKQVEKKIKKIDKIINNKEMLMIEYEKRNEKLPLEKKIFSVRVLRNILKDERDSLIEEIRNQNRLIKPQNFLIEKNKIKNKLKYFSIIEQGDYKEQIKKNLLNLQKEIIKCMYIDTERIKTKQELIEQIYKYRYYMLLPINNKKLIYQEKELASVLKKLTKSIIDKAIEMKVINKMSKNDQINYEIIKKILLSKIIFLQYIHIKINILDESVILTIYDEEIEENKIILNNITKDDIIIKPNKKIKLFN